MNKLCKSFLLCSLCSLGVSVQGAVPSYPLSGSAISKIGSGSLVLRNSIVWQNIYNSADADEASGASNLIGTDPKFVTDTKFALLPESPAIKKGNSTYNTNGESIEGWEYYQVNSSGAFGTPVAVAVETDDHVVVSISTTPEGEVADQVFEGQLLPYGIQLYFKGLPIKGYTNPQLILNGSPATAGTPYQLTGFYTLEASASLQLVDHYGVYTVSNGLSTYNNIFYNNLDADCNFSPDATNLVDSDPGFVTDTKFALQVSSPAIGKGNAGNNSNLKSIEGWVYTDSFNASGAFGIPAKVTVETDGHAFVFLASDASGSPEIFPGELVAYGTNLYLRGAALKGYSTPDLKFDGSPALAATPYRLTGSHVVDASATKLPSDRFGIYGRVNATLDVHNNIFYSNQDSTCNFVPGATNLVDINPEFITDTRFALQLTSPAIELGDATENTEAKSIEGWDYYPPVNSSGAFGTPVGISVESDGNVIVGLYTDPSGNPESEVKVGQALPYGTPLYVIKTFPSNGYQVSRMLLNGTDWATISSPFELRTRSTLEVFTDLVGPSHFGLFSQTASGLTVLNNISYGNVDGNFNAQANGTNVIAADPKFDESFGNTDFRHLRLTAGSPATASGLRSNHPYNHDIAKAEFLPQEVNPTISSGAYYIEPAVHPTPGIIKDLEDVVVCLGKSHTFEILVEGYDLQYEWYYGNQRIPGANKNTYRVNAAEMKDYERYQVIVRTEFNGYKASIYSKSVYLVVANPLPEPLQFSNFPDIVVTGTTHRMKLAGYSEVTKYSWSYTNDDVTFSPSEGGVGENETWASFGSFSAGIGTLTATLEHPCGTRQLTRIVDVRHPNGTESVSGTAIRVSPNPTVGLVQVSNTKSNQTIQVLDLTGSLKGSYPTQDGATTIDLKGYPKGSYLLQYNGKAYKVIKE